LPQNPAKDEDIHLVRLKYYFYKFVIRFLFFFKDLLACAAMWQSVSPALYRQILDEDIVSLPSVSYIKRLSASLHTQTGMSLSTKNYLKARINELTNQERIVVLIFDEIYCSQRVEFSGGSLYGVQDGAVCKTILAFMVQVCY
jgi:hypothetical protein